MRKLPVLVTSLILVLGIMLGMMMFETSSADDRDSIVASYNNLTNRVLHPITVTEVARQLEELSDADNAEPIVPLPGGTDISDGIDTSDWLTVVDSVHKTWGGAGLYYDQHEHMLTDAGGNSVTVRTDCSGYVSYCLHMAGYINDHLSYWSGNFSDMLANKAGWTLVEEDTSDSDTRYSSTELIAGDILIYSGHVEIYQGTMFDATRPNVWNWGGHSSAQDKYKNKDPKGVTSYSASGHSLNQILSVWRMSSGGASEGTTQH